MTNAHSSGIRGQSHAVGVDPLENGELNPLPLARLTEIWLSSSFQNGYVLDHNCGLCATWTEKKATRTANANAKISRA